MAFNQIQAAKTTLSGAGISASDITIPLSNLQTQDGVAITTANIGDIGYATIDPGVSGVEENISFTTITQNGDGSATLSGVTRGLDNVSPYTGDSSRAKGHSGGATLVMSNSAAFYEQYSRLADDQTYTGTVTYTTSARPTLTVDSDSATVTDLVTVGQLNRTALGSPTIDDITVSGTAGETIAAGNLVYLNNADSRWYLVSAAATATVDQKIMGIARGAGTAGGSITDGVLTEGNADFVSGLTANSVYYASDTGGVFAATPGTVEYSIGIATSTTSLYFQPGFLERVSENQRDQLEAIEAASNLDLFYFNGTVLTPVAGGTAGQIPRINTAATAVEWADNSGPVTSVTAGETINGATLPVPVYQSSADGEFYATDANDNTRYRFSGFAITDGTDGNPFTLQASGVVTGFSSLTQGAKYYVQDAVGTIGTSPGTHEIYVGLAISSTSLLIQKGKQRAIGAFTIAGNTTITTGFRPSRISVYSHAFASGPHNSASSGVWISPNSQQTVFVTEDGIEGSANDRVAYASNASVFILISVTSVTDTGFTFNVSQNGLSLNIVYDVEGDY